MCRFVFPWQDTGLCSGKDFSRLSGGGFPGQRDTAFHGSVSTELISTSWESVGNEVVVRLETVAEGGDISSWVS